MLPIVATALATRTASDDDRMVRARDHEEAALLRRLLALPRDYLIFFATEIIPLCEQWAATHGPWSDDEPPAGLEAACYLRTLEWQARRR